ncbi:N-acetyltransferase [Sphingobacteriaceae bacterium]|nr:N-acetyltransferase [Sphingobacteriaceae bacterium]
MEFESLYTERLQLKKFTPEGLKYVFDTFSKEEVRKKLGLLSDEEFEREKMKIEGGFKTYDRTLVHFKLILKESNDVIGAGGFHNWYAIHRRAELGYMLNKDDYKKKGYMHEAVCAMLDYGFTTMDLNRVEASIAPENVASQALILKNGFTREAYLKQNYISDGIIFDSVIYRLLKEEYEIHKRSKV